MQADNYCLQGFKTLEPLLEKADLGLMAGSDMACQVAVLLEMVGLGLWLLFAEAHQGMEAHFGDSHQGSPVCSWQELGKPVAFGKLGLHLKMAFGKLGLYLQVEFGKLGLNLAGT